MREVNFYSIGLPEVAATSVFEKEDGSRWATFDGITFDGIAVPKRQSPSNGLYKVFIRESTLRKILKKIAARK